MFSGAYGDGSSMDMPLVVFAIVWQMLSIGLILSELPIAVKLE